MATLIYVILRLCGVVECYLIPDIALVCLLLALDTISFSILFSAWLAARRHKQKNK
jgi:hypothetical protein